MTVLEQMVVAGALESIVLRAHSEAGSGYGEKDHAVKLRRQAVGILHREGRSTRQIAEKLETSMPVIREDLRHI